MPTCIPVVSDLLKVVELLFDDCCPCYVAQMDRPPSPSELEEVAVESFPLAKMMSNDPPATLAWRRGFQLEDELLPLPVNAIVTVQHSPVGVMPPVQVVAKPKHAVRFMPAVEKADKPGPIADIQELEFQRFQGADALRRSVVHRQHLQALLGQDSSDWHKMTSREFEHASTALRGEVDKASCSPEQAHQIHSVLYAASRSRGLLQQSLGHCECLVDLARARGELEICLSYLCEGMCLAEELALPIVAFELGELAMQCLSECKPASASLSMHLCAEVNYRRGLIALHSEVLFEAVQAHTFLVPALEYYKLDGDDSACFKVALALAEHYAKEPCVEKAHWYLEEASVYVGGKEGEEELSLFRTKIDELLSRSAD